MSLHSNDPENGTMLDYQVVGMVAFYVVIILANIRIWLFSNNFYVAQVIFLVGSVLLFPIQYWWWAKIETNDIYGYFWETFSRNFWIVVAITTAVCALFDWAFEKFQSKLRCVICSVQFLQRDGDRAGEGGLPVQQGGPGDGDGRDRGSVWRSGRAWDGLGAEVAGRDLEREPRGLAARAPPRECSEPNFRPALTFLDPRHVRLLARAAHQDRDRDGPGVAPATG
jgi:hypothetical protein